MTANNGIAITGVGTIGPHGTASRRSATRSAPAGRCARRSRPWLIIGCTARALRRSPPMSTCRHGCPPAPRARMSPLSADAVAAAAMALRDAPDSSPLAVAIGTGFGSTSFTEKLMHEIVELGPEAASPFLFTDCVANAPRDRSRSRTGRGPPTRPSASAKRAACSRSTWASANCATAAPPAPCAAQSTR
jgi:hypothetical protein